MKKTEQRKGTADTWHIFDNTFTTMCSKMGIIVIPMLNERLGTNYSLTSKVTFLSEKSLDNGVVRCQDCKLSIEGDVIHAECQSNPDGNIIIRFLKYEFPYSLDAAIKECDGKLHIKFPQPLLLQLRGKGSDFLEATLEMADGSRCNYRIPVVYAQEYSLEEIFQKKLYILLPFYILRYEERIKAAVRNNEDALDEILVNEMQDDLRKIIRELGKELEHNRRTWGDKLFVNMEECIKDIFDYVLSDYKEAIDFEDLVGKELKRMGGVILRLPSDEIEEQREKALKEGREEGKKQGIKEGIQEGIKEGIKEGENRLALLIEKLSDAGRNDEIPTVSDAGVRQRLYKEFGIS